MKPKPLLTAAAALLGAVLVWRVVEVESEVGALRAELAEMRSTPPTRVETAKSFSPAPEVSGNDSLASRESTLPNPTGFERMLEELDQAKDRVAGLEGTVNELADAWNQFAEEEEARRAQRPRKALVQVLDQSGDPAIYTSTVQRIGEMMTRSEVSEAMLVQMRMNLYQKSFEAQGKAGARSRKNQEQ